MVQSITVGNIGNGSMPPELTFTRTEQKILRVLDDGMPHAGDELVRSFDDSESTIVNVQAHLVRIRRVLRRFGEDIIFTRVGAERRGFYQRVRLTASPYDGKR